MSKKRLNSEQVMGWMRENARYLLFLCALSFLTIMNGHVAEKKVRKIIVLKNESKELNWKYLTLKSQWKNQTSLSHLEDDLDENEIGKEGTKPLIIKSRGRR